jgi:hypothetical protein
MDLCL